MKITIINCVNLDAKDLGNPAAVITGFIRNKISKQVFAKQLNLPVTVFINDEELLSPTLEYFYPQTEMPSCLHGTLAAAHVLLENRSTTSLICLTASEKIQLVITATPNLIQVEVAEKPVPQVIVTQQSICDTLQLEEKNIDNNFPSGFFFCG